MSDHQLYVGSLDVNKIRFGAPYKIPDGMQSMIPITVGDGGELIGWDGRLRFQLGRDETDMVVTPYGLNQPFDQRSDPTRRTLSVTVNTEIETKLLELDAYILKNCNENCNTFFGKLHDDEAVHFDREADKRDLPEVRLKVLLPKMHDGQSERGSTNFTNVMLMSAGSKKVRPANAEDIGRNALLLPVVEISGIWFDNSRFGVTLTAKGILFDSGSNKSQKTGLSMFSLSDKTMTVECEAPSRNDDEDL